MRNHIPNLYIRLPWYKFYDSPQAGNVSLDGDDKYIERSTIEAHLKARILDNTANRSGSILVTGYRGVGKTSLTRNVLRKLNKESTMGLRRNFWKKMVWDLGGPGEVRVHHLEINLAEDEIDQRAILRLMAVKLLEVMGRIRMRPWDRVGMACRVLPYLFGIGAFFLALPHIGPHVLFTTMGPCHHEVPAGGSTTAGQAGTVCMDGLVMHGLGPITAEQDGYFWMRFVDVFLLPALVGLFTYWLWRQFLRRTFQDRIDRSTSRLKDRLQLLIARIGASVTTEDVRGLQGATYNPFAFGRRKSISYPIAKTKEIEIELIDILDQFGIMDSHSPPVLPEWAMRLLCRLTKVEYDQPRYRQGHNRIVFLVDELDKLTPRAPTGVIQKDDQDLTDERGGEQRHTSFAADHYRRRQEAIATLFANLKHFLNVAQAKFIFIGSREMFDAVMADTSNRDAFFSSVFNHVVYVPTFLKERQSDGDSERSGLTTTIERFVLETLLTRAKVDQLRQPGAAMVRISDISDQYRPWLFAQPDQQRAQEQLEQMLSAVQNYAIYLTFRSNGIPKKLMQLYERSMFPVENAAALERLKKDPNNLVMDAMDDGPGLFLRLDATAQHAHMLMTYFCRPFTSIHSHYYRSLNDKQLVSLTYLLDHLFKFHPNAFSFAHLEMAPEAIALNKVPEVRKYISDILLRLSDQHLRTIDNGLYGYVFFAKTYQEIAYFSKVSELDAAAMNFTLDESQAVKQLFNKRLRELHLKFKDTNVVEKEWGIQPISDIHAQLGDLHFYDAEHADALEHFRSAALHFERSAQRGKHFMLDHFHEYVRLKLKETHCLERIKAMDEAVVTISSLCELILQVIRRDPAPNVWNVDMRRLDIRLLGLTMHYALALRVKSRGMTTVYASVGWIDRFAEAVREEVITHPQSFALDRFQSMACSQAGSVLFFSNLRLKYDAKCRSLIPNMEREDCVLLYKTAVDHLLNTQHDHEWEEKLEALKRPEKRLDHQTWSTSGTDDDLTTSATYQLAANAMSKYADALVAEAYTGAYEQPTKAEFMGVRVNWILADPEIGKVAYFLLLTGRCYADSGQYFQAVFQVKKLLFVLLERKMDPPLTFAAMDQLKDLKKWAIGAVHLYNGHIDVQQRSKSARPIVQPTGSLATTTSVRGISYQSELVEMDILWHRLELTHRPAGPQREKALDDAFAFLHVHRHLVTLQFTRALLLELTLQYNWIRAGLGGCGIFDRSTPVYDWSQHIGATLPLNTHVPGRESIRELVADSIHCCFHLLNIFNLSGISFVNNHTRIGLARMRLGNWTAILRSMETYPMRLANAQEVRNAAAEIKKDVSRWADGNVENRLDPLMHYTLAHEDLTRGMGVHNGGKHQRRIIGDLFFLEDNYADNLFHFSCAMERRVVQRVSKGNSSFRSLITAVRKNVGAYEVP